MVVDVRKRSDWSKSVPWAVMVPPPCWLPIVAVVVSGVFVCCFCCLMVASGGFRDSCQVSDFAKFGG